MASAAEDIIARGTIDLNQALLAFRRGETDRAAKNIRDVLKSLGQFVEEIEK